VTRLNTFERNVLMLSKELHNVISYFSKGYLMFLCSARNYTMSSLISVKGT
jgi:hypothetical protein